MHWETSAHRWMPCNQVHSSEFVFKSDWSDFGKDAGIVKDARF